MKNHLRRDLTQDLFLPTLFFAALGAMTWAVRGCSGFGAMNGCAFAGVTWGAAWWFLARDPGRQQSRRYSSGWIILALLIGIGISGNRGWMQWPSFFEGRLQTSAAEGKFVPISPLHGFVWLFIAGVPWAGLGACMLAWCGPKRPARLSGWCLRIACGVGAAMLARVLFEAFPEVFLPLYSTLKSQYADLDANPSLRRLIGDNRAAILHLGLYLGFLGYEMGRRDRKNVTLILTVGLLNGLGWALCQNWRWAAPLWPDAHFNFWRCWESSGGISIGIALGIAYFLVNGRMSAEEIETRKAMCPCTCPNLERLAVALGLVFGLGLSIKNGLKGWANIYLGNEEYWNQFLWKVISPLMLACLAAAVVWIRCRPIARDDQGDVFPHAYRLAWLVVIVQNVIAQLITGPHTDWSEMAFSIYYLLLFAISAVILVHFRFVKVRYFC